MNSKEFYIKENMITYAIAKAEAQNWEKEELEKKLGKSCKL